MYAGTVLMLFLLGSLTSSEQLDVKPFTGEHGHKNHAQLRKRLSNATYETVCTDANPPNPLVLVVSIL